MIGLGSDIYRLTRYLKSDAIENLLENCISMRQNIVVSTMPLTMLPSRRLFGGLLIARKRFIESFQPQNLLCEDSSAHISTFGPVGNEMRSSRLPLKLYKGMFNVM